MTARVLIVDDDPNLLASLVLVMEHGGYEVHTAQTGEEALAGAERWAPQLVLLDVMLPGLDGYAVCQRLRADPRRAGLRVVMLSARVRPVEVAKGLALGADAYLTKPFSIRDLRDEVRRQLEAGDAAGR